MFFADESGVRSDFHAGTTWGIRGKTPVVRPLANAFISICCLRSRPKANCGS